MTQSILNALEANASDIISDIPDFYRYDYGYDNNELRNGGLNMYSPSGMNVRIITIQYSIKFFFFALQ